MADQRLPHLLELMILLASRNDIGLLVPMYSLHFAMALRRGVATQYVMQHRAGLAITAIHMAQQARRTSWLAAANSTTIRAPLKYEAE